MRSARERGSATVEMVLLAPVMMALVMLVVLVHRQTDASLRVARAADVGARAASLSRTSSMLERGVRAARQDLATGSAVCTKSSVSLDTRLVGRFTVVSVTVTCETSARGLGLLGVGRRRISSTSTEIVDFYTGR